MPIVPIKLPPGMLKNGTPYQQRGRWVDGNLIRWRDNAVESIGGWVPGLVLPIDNIVDSGELPLVVVDIVDAGVVPAVVANIIDGASASDYISVLILASTVDDCVRDIFAWRSLTQDAHMVFGSNRKLMHLSNLNVITDITPAGINVSSKDPSTVVGYGRNPYGFGNYGVGNDIATDDTVPPQRWGFGTFGEVLLFVQRGFGPLRQLLPSTLVTSSIATAPVEAMDVAVTDQRIVMTVGGTTGPRSVNWSDQEDRTDWTPNIANQAGSQTLSGIGKLLRVVPILGHALILGEADVHVASYLGAPFIFGFRMVGERCGLICPEAVVCTDRFVTWWGKDNFWTYDGSLKYIKCAVMDYLKVDADRSVFSKISCFSMAEHNEIWWLYQSYSTATGEVDSYVIWNYTTDTWNCGRIHRSAGVDAGVNRYPVMVSPDAEVFSHEMEGTVPTGLVYAVTGPLEVPAGVTNLAIKALFPDTTTFGQMTVTGYAKQLPTSQEFTYGPYPYNNPTPMRIMGREIRLRYDKVPESQEFCLGEMRIDAIGTSGR